MKLCVFVKLMSTQRPALTHLHTHSLTGHFLQSQSFLVALDDEEYIFAHCLKVGGAVLADAWLAANHCTFDLDILTSDL